MNSSTIEHIDRIVTILADDIADTTPPALVGCVFETVSPHYQTELVSLAIRSQFHMFVEFFGEETAAEIQNIMKTKDQMNYLVASLRDRLIKMLSAD